MPAYAGDVLWAGTTHDWYTAANWSGGSLPTSSDMVYIDAVQETEITHIGAAADTVFVGQDHQGALAITDAGALSFNAIIVGNHVGSSGTLSISGATTDLAAGLILGENGTGSVVISDGATVNLTNLILGDGATGSGSFVAEGTGTTANLFGSVAVGSTGSGSFSVLDGAQVNASSNFYIVGGNSATKTLTVSGQGTSLLIDGSFHALQASSATILVSDGAAVASDGITLHFDSGGGTILTTVTGAGTTWTSTGPLAVGDSATLQILDGAQVTADGMSFYSGATALVIDGVGSRLDLSSTLYELGSFHSITVSDGGVFSDTGSTLLGYDSSSSVLVTGVGSVWNNTGSLVIGTAASSGHVAVTINDGATLTSSDGQIGVSAGNGQITLSGVGTSWTNSGTLSVGYGDGHGALSILNGAQVANLEAKIGYANATGMIVVSGAHTVWTIDGDLNLGGNDGQASLVVSDGAVVTNDAALLSLAEAPVTVAVSGSGTRWISSGLVTIGKYGSYGAIGADVSISGGAYVESEGAILGTGGAHGIVTVSGPTTQWINNGTMTMGDSGGVATITVADGAYVETGVISMGTSSATTSINVTGAGSRFIDTGSLYMAEYGATSTLRVAEGGLASISGVMTLGGDYGTAVVVIGADEGSAAVAPGTLLTPSIVFGSVGAGSVIFNHTSSAYMFAAALSGPGTLKFLSGKTILTGDSSLFTGTTDIEGGTLAVNGSLGGVTSIGSGGRLQGSGAVDEVDLASGATIAPGNSIGTLHVSGPVTFASGSVYEAEINGSGVGDKIIATGVVTLAGTLNVVAAAGTYHVGTRYTLLSASGGISGPFDTMTTTFGALFLTPELGYSGTDAYVTIARNAVPFVSVADTANRAEAAQAVESQRSGSLYDTIASQDSVSAARAAFQQVAGELHADVKGSVEEAGPVLADVLFNRMAESADSVAGSTASLRGKKKTPAFAPVAWAQGFGRWGTRESDGNAQEATYAGQGLLLGLDGVVRKGWRAGVAFGASHGRDYVQDGSNARGTTDSYSLAFYGVKKLSRGLSARLGADYGYHHIETKRTLSFAGEDSTLSADHAAHALTGFGEVAYGFAPRSGTRLEPFANLAYGYVVLPSFRESGGDGALSVEDGSAPYGVAQLGVRGRQSVMFLAPRGGHGTLTGSVAWRRAIGDTGPNAKYHLAGSDAFTITGAPLAKDAAALEVGYYMDVMPNLTIGLSYNGLFANKTDNQAINGNMRFAF